jgi:hypothetical protein
MNDHEKLVIKVMEELPVAIFDGTISLSKFFKQSNAHSYVPPVELRTSSGIPLRKRKGWQRKVRGAW